MDNIIVQFDYDNDRQRQFCEAKAHSIRHQGQETVKGLAVMGEDMEDVKDEFRNEDKWGRWVYAQFGFSKRQAYRYTNLYFAVKRTPELVNLWCMDAVFKFGELPPGPQKAVIEAGAWRPDEFKRVAFESAVQEHLDDDGLKYERTRGDALNAIQDAMNDPVLEPIARDLYEQHRDEFARLADRPPADVDQETLPRPYQDPQPGRPVVTVSTERRYALCEADANGEMRFLRWVERTWNLNGDILLGSFELVNGPVSRVQQQGGIDALDEYYGILRGLYEEEAI